MIARSRLSDSAERVDIDRARELMLAAAEPVPSEMVPLGDAHGRIVAALLRADADIVPYARSAMDGFALRAFDTVNANVESVVLPVVGLLYAGDVPTKLAHRSAMAIATGAPLPDGADAVVPIEGVSHSGDAIVLAAPLEAGAHVFPAGDDVKRGEILVRPGDTVTPGRAALLAAAGHALICVRRRPRVAIVCTGDEVVAVNARPGPGEIRNSNAAMLALSLARDGAEVVLCAHVTDSPEPLQAMLRQAIEVSDVVITTGGASAGERDLVKDTFVALGARFAFRSIALRPAKPTGFAQCGRALIAVLPGNPAAAFVAYEMLVRGLLGRLAGHAQPPPARISATLTGSIRSKPERHFVVFGSLGYEDGTFSVEPLGNQCSSLVRTSADANALIIVPPGTGELLSGASVCVQIIDWNAVRFRGPSFH